jgi:SWIM/SEC-C metal-binding protein
MARLGSDKRPAVLRVQTIEKAQEVLAFCDGNGWKAIVGVEPHEREDLTDLYRLMGELPEDDEGPGPPATARAPTVGRNDPCPCGSGRKYKRCCASAARAQGATR